MKDFSMLISERWDFWDRMRIVSAVSRIEEACVDSSDLICVALGIEGHSVAHIIFAVLHSKKEFMEDNREFWESFVLSHRLYEEAFNKPFAWMNQDEH